MYICQSLKYLLQNEDDVHNAAILLYRFRMLFLAIQLFNVSAFDDVPYIKYRYRYKKIKIYKTTTVN